MCDYVNHQDPVTTITIQLRNSSYLDREK